MDNYGYTESQACKLVADEYPSICGLCHSEHCGSFPPAPTRPPSVSSPIQVDSVKVMSYNTEYTGYWDGRIDNFANHIKSVNADIVGLQECQNARSIAKKSGYTPLVLLQVAMVIRFCTTRLFFKRLTVESSIFLEM